MWQASRLEPERGIAVECLIRNAKAGQSKETRCIYDAQYYL
jgi:hypothetical protein